jgi:transcriptional regulator with XRE-family HTH domain
MSGFSDRLRQAREQAGFATKADAARALGEPLPTYYGHENGHRGGKRPSPETVMKYARRFGVSVEWLLNGTGLKKARNRPDFEVMYERLDEDQRAEVLRFMEFHSLKNRP